MATSEAKEIKKQETLVRFSIISYKTRLRVLFKQKGFFLNIRNFEEIERQRQWNTLCDGQSHFKYLSHAVSGLQQYYSKLKFTQRRLESTCTLNGTNGLNLSKSQIVVH